MTRKEFICRVTELMTESGYRKRVPAQKTTFHITDDQGGASNFTVRREPLGVRMTKEDIAAVLEAMLRVIVRALQDGDNLNISTYFNLHLHKRKERFAPHPVTGEIMKMKEHFLVKLDPYAKFRTAADVYLAKCEDMQNRAESVVTRSDSYYDEDEDNEEVIEDGRD